MDKNQSSDEDVSEPDHLPSEETHQVPLPKKRKTEPKQGECSTLSPAVNEEDSALAYEAKTGKKEMDIDENVSMDATKWPDFVLKLIFRFLCVCDLVNVQKVCKSWKKATEDSAVWRHVVVSTKDIFTMLPTVPYVQTIEGIIFDENQLNVIKNNVYDLRNIKFEICIKNLSSTTFQEFIKKFQNLEFITITNYSSVIMESLDLLSNLPNLKTLRIGYHIQSENFPQFCRLVADKFPAVRDLHIYHEYGKRVGKDCFSELLRNKITQLTDLMLSYNNVHPSIFDLIFESAKMKTIFIDVEDCLGISFNMSKMINLKSLNIQASFNCDYHQRFKKNFVETFKTLVFPKNLQNLKLLFDSHIKSPPDIVNNIINFLPNLRVLSISGVSNPDIDQQLEQISDLQHLHTVSFQWCSSLSAKGVENILRCAQLRNLKLYMGDHCPFEVYVSFEDKTYNHLKECKFLGNLKLHNCVLELEKLLPTILAMRYLTNLNIWRCKGKSETGELLDLNRSVITDIIETCKNEKHSVNIES